jgi:hypothetical protein
VAARRPTPLPSRLSAPESAAHDRLVAAMGADAIWAQYVAPGENVAAQ